MITREARGRGCASGLGGHFPKKRSTRLSEQPPRFSFAYRMWCLSRPTGMLKTSIRPVQGGMPWVMRFVLANTLVVSQLVRAPAQTGPQFEVVSIKPSDPATAGNGIFNSPGEFAAKRVTVQDLVAFAYDVRSLQLSGGPAWLDSDRFDIIATPGGSQQVRAMVEASLADRFKLSTHRETKTMPVYELVIAKSGAKLQKATDGETMSIRGGVFRNVGPPLLAKYLSGQLDRMVVDKTGMQGTYDFTLKWTPDTAQTPALSSSTMGDAPSIFTAVQEQLGLRLQPARGPVEVIVIDHVEKPLPN
ncbi:MAG TPA: TIGR03435 family protein [Bryobacteraceae bacterium]|nr:TIGR03435 family protein [Bryobacteraceae bacterium]